MSGGHFDYNQYRIEDIAVEIDVMIESNDDKVLDVFGARSGYSYPPEIIEKFKEAAHTLRRAAEMVKRIDYLVSGDDGQESFLRLWQEAVQTSRDAPAPCSAGCLPFDRETIIKRLSVFVGDFPGENLKVCLNCRFAAWETTPTGRFKTAGSSVCTFPLVGGLPVVAREQRSQPCVFSFEECPCFEPNTQSQAPADATPNTVE